MDSSCQTVFKCVAWLDLTVLWWFTHELNMSFFKLPFFIPKRHHHSYTHQSMSSNITPLCNRLAKPSSYI